MAEVFDFFHITGVFDFLENPGSSGIFSNLLSRHLGEYMTGILKNLFFREDRFFF
jgi:hypothetical protein